LTTYREATAHDWEEIAALHAASWQKAYRGALRDDFLDGPVVESRRERWRERFAEPPANQYVVIAEDADGAMIGFAAAYGESDPVLGTLLDNLHVLPGHQGEGVGRRLVAHVAAWALRAYPGVPLYLDVLEGNSRARRFYERIGGTEAGNDAWDAPDGERHPVVHYAWTIEGMRALVDAVPE
jgi:GNAT superfamily N-acetyltransferase